MRYRTILADCPWEFHVWGKGVLNSRLTEQHYVCQGPDYLKSLPVPEIAERDCALLFWSTNPMLPQALEVITAWGFKYSTKLTWVKMARAGAPRIGLGYRARSCTEDLLICTRGDVPAPATGDRPCGVIFSPRGEHSRKPDWQYDLAELYPGPYVELFARPRPEGLWDWKRPGWEHLGNECEGNLDMREALDRLACEEPSPPALSRQARAGREGSAG